MEVQDVERQHIAAMKTHAERKGKGKAVSTSFDEPSRYKEAVEEKKGMCIFFCLVCQTDERSKLWKH